MNLKQLNELYAEMYESAVRQWILEERMSDGWDWVKELIKKDDDGLAEN